MSREDRSIIEQTGGCVFNEWDTVSGGTGICLSLNDGQDARPTRVRSDWAGTTSRMPIAR